jgi:ABC-2 type transport system ATP-binding protein
MTAPLLYVPSPLVEPMAARSAISFRGVVKRFGATFALDVVDVEVALGETVALLGPNGAGKSTAIAIMLGLADPTLGRAITLGLEPRQAVQTGRIGAMLQAGGLPAGVRVGELVDFVRRLYPQPLSRADALTRAGLTELADRQIETLSGGEAQRVRFALAIAGDPDLVFLDEPTVAMDVQARRTFWNDMRRSAAEGRTILFATHYLEEADQVADRIIVLDRGRVVADGTGASIKSAVTGRTVRFTTAVADRARLAALPGVSEVEVRGQRVSLASSDADATVRALLAAGLPVSNLEVVGAGLEEAFLALTRGEEPMSDPQPNPTDRGGPTS